MGVLYSNNDSFSDDQDYNDEDGKYEVLKKQMTSDLKQTYGYSDTEASAKATLTAYCFLLFVLLYFPCIATIAAIKGETGSWKWAGFAAGYTTLLAWVVSALVFQIGSLFLKKDTTIKSKFPRRKRVFSFFGGFFSFSKCISDLEFLLHQEAKKSIDASFCFQSVIRPFV